MMRERVQIPLNLTVLWRNRPLRRDVIDQLKTSMAEVGQLQPILAVREAVCINGVGQQGWHVIAGANRTTAAKELDWSTIDAFVVTREHALEAELIQIDENLIRGELSASQRAEAIKRRRDIWQQIHPEGVTTRVGQIDPPEIGDRKPPPAVRRFAGETADATGMAKRAINRELHRADALGDDLEAVQGTALDKGVELDALAKMTHEERAPLIERAQAGEAVSARTTPVAKVAPPAPPPAPTGAVEVVTSMELERDRRLVRQMLAEVQRVADAMDLGRMCDALQGETIGRGQGAVIATLHEMARHHKVTANG